MTMTTGDLVTPGPVSPPKKGTKGSGAPKGVKGGQFVTRPSAPTRPGGKK